MTFEIGKTISTDILYHYDQELFDNQWTTEPDPYTLALLESGAMVADAKLARIIAGGGNFGTLPFYKDLEGTISNYDGGTDIYKNKTKDGSQNFVVYGRAVSFGAEDFINDFTAADPLAHILNRIQNFWGKDTQKIVLGILDAVLGITGTGDFADWELHKKDVSSSTATVTDANKLTPTTLRDLAVQANGDKADGYALAIMHSAVANTLSQFAVLDYFKFNDANGLERDVKVARSGNMLVIVFDGVTTETATIDLGSGATAEHLVYSTYCLGRGALLYARAGVNRPSSVERDEHKNGGEEYLVTRKRECIHPNWFSFYMEDLPISPEDTDLFDSANWRIRGIPKNIFIARIKTNA